MYLKYFKIIFVAVFVTILHLLLLLQFVSQNEEVATKKESVQRVDLRNVSIAPQPKPKPIVKPKPLVKPKVEPKSLAKPEVVEPEIVPEVVEEVQKPVEDMQEVEEVQELEEEVISQEASLSPSEVAEIKSHYITTIKRAIEQKKYYPKKEKRLNHEGIVEVSFIILKDGTIQEVAVKNPSKYKGLNQGALETLKRVARFEPIPEELALDRWEIVVPIEYTLR
jgi:TonB family protein